MHYCYALLLCITAMHYCYALLLCITAMHYCYALLIVIIYGFDILFTLSEAIFLYKFQNFIFFQKEKIKKFFELYYFLSKSRVWMFIKIWNMYENQNLEYDFSSKYRVCMNIKI